MQLVRNTCDYHYFGDQVDGLCGQSELPALAHLLLDLGDGQDHRLSVELEREIVVQLLIGLEGLMAPSSPLCLIGKVPKGSFRVDALDHVVFVAAASCSSLTLQ